MTGGPFDLSGKGVLVVGGAGLLGRPVSVGIDAHGASVVVADRDKQAAETVATNLTNGTAAFVDVTDEASIQQVCETTIQECGGLDALVNASYPKSDGYGTPLEDLDADTWNRAVDHHLGGYYATAREAFIRMLEADNGGSIVNFASIYGMQAPDFSIYQGTDLGSPVEYAAIKGGILNLTRYLASYGGPDGIRVNAVSPGGVYDDQAERFVANYERSVPLERMAEPADVVGGVIYLISDAASYVTGHNLVIDGGWTIQ